jgi:hypothetical protein
MSYAAARLSSIVPDERCAVGLGYPRYRSRNSLFLSGEIAGGEY